MFELYTEEHRIFEFEDYGAILDECAKLKPLTVLEFGPGISTYAFVEAGVERIATCEYKDAYLQKAIEDFKQWPHVTVHRFLNNADVEVLGLTRSNYDLAFVDSPVGIESKSSPRFPGQEDCSRLNTCIYALSRAPVILLHDAKRDGEQATLARLQAMGCIVEMIDTTKGIARVARVKEQPAIA
jgi:hypothetical protein